MSVIKLNISDVSPGFSASDNMFQSPAMQSGGGDMDGGHMILLVLVVLLVCSLLAVSVYFGYKKYMGMPVTSEGFQSHTIDDRDQQYY